MMQSLSVVLRVTNAEAVLRLSIESLIDVVEGIAAHFRLIVVDDGSTDDTFEVANELCREFPQLEVLRHGSQRGPHACLRSALPRLARGHVLLLDDPAAAQPGMLSQLLGSHALRSSAREQRQPHYTIQSRVDGSRPRGRRGSEFKNGGCRLLTWNDAHALIHAEGVVAPRIGSLPAAPGTLDPVGI